MVDIAGRIPLERLASGNAALDDVMQWNGSRWVAAPAPAGAGAGLLGSAYITFGFPNVAANGTTVQATSSAAAVVDSGTPAVSQSAGTITYCTDNVASYYLINARANWSGVTGGAATDVFRIQWNDWLTRFVATALGITDGSTGPSMTQGGPLSSSGGMQPELVADCPNGTGRTLTGVTLQYAILRFAT